MTTLEQIKKTATDFVRAGDTNDVALLDRVLHPRFQNVQDSFFAEQGVFVFSKEDYKRLVETRKFGGTTRTIKFGPIEILGHLAHVKVRLENQLLIFNTTLLLCYEGEGWTVIHNIPTIEKKP